jgi:membrane protein
MNRFFITIWALIKGTFDRSKIGDPVLHAAAIAFFTIFSLPPTLIIVVAFAGKFYGEKAVQGEIAEQISDMVGPESATQIQDILEQNANAGPTNMLFSIIGIVTLLFSATVVFTFIKKAINSIWGVKPKPHKNFVKFFVDRLISFSLIILLGLFLLFSLVIDAALILLHDYLEKVLSDIHMDLMHVVNYSLSIVVVTIIFAVMFKFLPDAKVKWRDVWMGAIVTAVLFKFGTYLIGIILRETELASAYGATGSLAALLLWVFYSTIIMLVGAEFTYIYSKMKGRLIRPRKHAVNVEVREIEYEQPQRVDR